VSRYLVRAGARIPRALFEHIAGIAKEHDRTVNHFVLKAIYAYLGREGRKGK